MNYYPYLGYEQLGYNPNFEIALNMSFEQLRFYCTSNEQFRQICSDQEFWKERIKRESPAAILYKPVNTSWAQYYSDASLIHDLLVTPGIIIPENMDPYQFAQEIKNGIIKTIVVVYNGQKIGEILMFPTDIEIDVTRRAINLLSLVNPNYDRDTTKMDHMKFATANTNIKEDVLIRNPPASTLRYYLNSNSRRNRSVQDPGLQQNQFDLWNNLQVINMYDLRFYQFWEFPRITRDFSISAF
jgi:hypothetical protein